MNKMLVSLLGVGVLGAAFAIWLVTMQDDARRSDARARSEARSVATSERTIADAWTMSDSAREVEIGEPRGADEPPRVDAASVRTALRDVRLDEAGNVVVDHRALAALRDGFASIERLDAGQLADIQEIIRNGLPAPAGEQAATIVANYYQYQLAAQTMLGGAAGEDIAGSEAQLERLVELRRSYFGTETSERLFGDEHAYARFTLESMRLAADESLSPEERQRRQEALTQMLPARLRAPDSAAAEPVAASAAEMKPDFAARYAEFERQKRAILAAGLVDDEKNVQLERLLREHFAADEIDAALRYDAERAVP